MADGDSTRSGGAGASTGANTSANANANDGEVWATDPVDSPQDGTLALGEDARLPWLEGDDEEEEQGGYGAGQVVLFALLGLLTLGLIVGGIWWATRVRADRDLVAEGGVIQAPDEPYKTRPAEPGGDIVAGTGDSSFAVAEGQTRPAQLGKDAAAAAPAADAPGAKAATPAATGIGDGAKPVTPTASATPPPAAQPSGPGVQVGAYSDRASAEAGWARLSQQYADLSGVSHRIVEGRADIGTVYRLQATPGDLAAAKDLCRRLQAAGVACYVKK